MFQVDWFDCFAGFTNPPSDAPAQVVAGRVEHGLGFPWQQAQFNQLAGQVARNIEGAFFQPPGALGTARPLPEPQPRLALFETGNNLETGN